MAVLDVEQRGDDAPPQQHGSQDKPAEVRCVERLRQPFMQADRHNLAQIAGGLSHARTCLVDSILPGNPAEGELFVVVLDAAVVLVRVD